MRRSGAAARAQLTARATNASALPLDPAKLAAALAAKEARDARVARRSSAGGGTTVGELYSSDSAAAAIPQSRRRHAAPAPPPPQSAVLRGLPPAALRAAHSFLWPRVQCSAPCSALQYTTAVHAEHALKSKKFFSCFAQDGSAHQRRPCLATSASRFLFKMST